MKREVIGGPLKMQDLNRLPDSEQWPNTSKEHHQVLESTSRFLKRYGFETKDKLEGAGPLHFHHPGTEDWERGSEVMLRPIPGPLGLSTRLEWDFTPTGSYMLEPEYKITGRGTDALEKILDMHHYQYTTPEITKGEGTVLFTYQRPVAECGFEPDMKLDDPNDPNTAYMRGPHGAKFKATKRGWTFTSPAGETESGTGLDKLLEVIGNSHWLTWGTKPGKGVTYDQD